MKVKTSLRCHLIPDRMCIIKKTKNNRCWWGCRGKLSPYILLVGISTSTAMIETSIEVPQKTKNRTTIWCSYTTSGYIPKWIKVRIQWRYLHTLVCCNNIHVAKLWNQLTEEWIKKMWYTPTLSPQYSTTHIQRTTKKLQLIGDWAQCSKHMGKCLDTKLHTLSSGKRLHINPAMTQSYLNIENTSTERQQKPPTMTSPEMYKSQSRTQDIWKHRQQDPNY
jgi:hypothetical protein